MEALLMRISGRWLQAVCHTTPGFICRTVPHAQESLSLASLYVFAQALGLLWVFLVSLLAVICTRIVTAVVQAGEAGAGGAAPLLDRPIHAVAVCYVYYCVVRMVGLFGRSMWTVAWEIYHNFPTMRHMLTKSRKNGGGANREATPAPVEASVSQQSLGRSTSGASVGSAAGVAGVPSSSPRTGPAKDPGSGATPTAPPTAGASKQQDLRRHVVLVTPLLVLALLNVVMLVGQLVCEDKVEECRDLIFFDPIGRINRNSRFVLFLSMIQWLQAWTGLFPYWYVALLKEPKGIWMRAASSLVIFLLVPASLFRLVLWFFKPAGIGVVQHLLGLRHHLVDSVLVIGWSIWMLLASVMIVRPGALRHSGFSPRIIRDDNSWKHLCTLFKYTLFFWQLAHFARGCIALGPAHAQNDLIAITVLYPMLLCFIWTVTFIAVALSRYGRNLRRTLLGFAAGIVVLFVVAQKICALVDRGDQPLLVTFVWLHLNRQAFRIVRRWARFVYLSQGTELDPPPKAFKDRSGSISFALDPKGHKELRRTYTVERKLGRVAIRVLLLICASFCAILATCVLMAGLQQRAGLFLTNIVWWRSLTEGVEVVNSRASVLHLHWANASLADSSQVLDPSVAVAGAEDEPHYAVCGHKWHGLQLVDYALMSLVTYMDPEESNGLPHLLNMLFPHKQVTIRRVGAGGARRWLELEVQTCKADGERCRNMSVVAVSGTDPTRIMDYVENLRMWTEPVSLQILSTVFPTVRIWPRDTTAMVIASIHGILKSMDVQDDKWHYSAILEHVRSLPADREVVITGHSLGGGIALVVGALTGRLAVAMQPPGVYHSLAKHQVQQHFAGRNLYTTLLGHKAAVHKRSVSLVFEGDWIQNFDGHGGLVQTMNCDQSRNSIAVGCHLLEGAICHLLRHCGDEAGRFATCEHEYRPTSTALDLARVALAFAKVSWESSYLFAHLDSVAMVGVTVSAIMVARYGAPSLPRSIFLSAATT